MEESTRKIAVVTGANKGIGWGIAKLLASKGITVIATARDVKRGLEAVNKLKEEPALSDRVVFHQLNVLNPDSIAALVDFVKTKFGKLDILVNNAGISGTSVDLAALSATEFTGTEGDILNAWSKILVETAESAEECINTNFYGVKRMSEALIPLLQFSDSPRIVNISSSMGVLKHIPGESIKRVLTDVDGLTEDKLDELLIMFLKDMKEGLLDIKGWPTYLSSYTISKAAVNTYTRILAKKYTNFCINSICPGFVRTDLNYNAGKLSVEEAVVNPVKLALLPNGGPSGLFYVIDKESSFE